MNKPICFLDLETTGTDKFNDRIVEICIIKMQDENTFESKQKLINPGIPISAEASAIHGITNEQVTECPRFAQIAKGILDYITDCDIAGFNSNSFDIPLLYNEFNRAGIVWDYSNVNFIDVCNIFKRKEERTLTAAVKYYLGRDHTDAHSAEADVIATMEIFKKQTQIYSDIPTDQKELAKYSNYDKDIVDLGNVFSVDVDGDYIFNYGKHKKLKAKYYPDYLFWMLREKFLPDAKAIAQKILKIL